jgi:hypothetical protein
MINGMNANNQLIAVGREEARVEKSQTTTLSRTKESFFQTTLSPWQHSLFAAQ